METPAVRAALEARRLDREAAADARRRRGYDDPFLEVISELLDADLGDLFDRDGLPLPPWRWPRPLQLRVREVRLDVTERWRGGELRSRIASYRFAQSDPAYLLQLLGKATARFRDANGKPKGSGAG